MPNDRYALLDSKSSKQDEFYTLPATVETELKHYEPHFNGKVVICNCNDLQSAFKKYFSSSFKRLGIKKAIVTGTSGMMIEITDIAESVSYLKHGGGFETSECLELLESADMVVTNPPFSKFREFLAILNDFNKKFLILGNVNALGYNSVFKMIRDGRLWLGPSIKSGDVEFKVPDDYPMNATNTRRGMDGAKYVSVKGVRWFTNLDYEGRYSDIELTAPYNPVIHKKYDNYDAINVDKVADIPKDYNGVMGVPVTFLDVWNPDQFEIVGLGNGLENFTPNKRYINPKKIMRNGKLKDGNSINHVLTLETNKHTFGKTYYICDGRKLTAPYARVLIKRKN